MQSIQEREDNIVNISNNDLSIVSHTHRNVILSFKPSLLWLAVIGVEVLNRLDNRPKPLNIPNFYIEGVDDSKLN